MTGKLILVAHFHSLSHMFQGHQESAILRKFFGAQSVKFPYSIVEK